MTTDVVFVNLTMPSTVDVLTCIPVAVTSTVSGIKLGCICIRGRLLVVVVIAVAVPLFCCAMVVWTVCALATPEPVKSAEAVAKSKEAFMLN